LLNQGIIDILPQEEMTQTNKQFTLSTYGFFLKTKGFIDIIKAFKILIDEGYDIKLLMLNARYSKEASDSLIAKAIELIDQYNLKDKIELNTDYLSDEECVSKLHKTDLVVFPYKRTGESSSAAIRMAIAAKANIAVTPQRIFDEVKEFSFVFEGEEVTDLVKGIKNSIQQIKRCDKKFEDMVEKREKFRKENLYSTLSVQLKQVLCSGLIMLNAQVEGTYENYYSLSMVNKSIALALQNSKNVEVKVDPTVYHTEHMTQVANIDKNIQSLVKKDLNPIDVSIRYIYPPYTTNMKGYHKIMGPYGWEESKFPQEYVQWFNTKLTMVFTMSDYVKKLLKNNGVYIPIVTTGIVVEDILHVESKSLGFSLPSGFRLLHISSGFPRKGVDKLLKVFDSFEKEKNITLIIKTFPNPHNKTVEYLEDKGFTCRTMYEENIYLYEKEKKQLLLINKDISQSNIKYLYENSNLLVAPSFGEGFGLPMAEAMLLDLPVLTTSFGGQSDFCTSKTSWLIDFDFAYAKTHINLKNSLWTVPKFSSLKQLILDISSLSNDKLKQKTIPAKQFILENYSSKKVAKNILTAIKEYKKTKTGSSLLLASKTKNDTDTFKKQLLQKGITKLKIEYNADFISLESLSELLCFCYKKKIQTELFLPSIKDIQKRNQTDTFDIIINALTTSTIIYVHTLSDMNYLKNLGIYKNTTIK